MNKYLRRFLYRKIRLGRHGFEISEEPLNRTSKILNYMTGISIFGVLFTFWMIPVAIGLFIVTLIYKEPERGKTA